MIRINDNYLKLKASYLFADIARRVQAHQEAHPQTEIIKLGIGDVTEPLPLACREAFHKAVDDLGRRESFHGYGPEQGYSFLREAIAENDYQSRGTDISADEIFISDGAKCDSGNIQEIFAQDTTIAVTDPVYPVYVDTNVMAGRTGSCVKGHYENLVYLESTSENDYMPSLPERPVDLIYLCFPNNPTGTTATAQQLQQWVDYARENNAVILFDAAYESFIRDDSLPHSIYEIEGARQTAIEFRSFSKNAGFTGTRCAFTVVPKELTAKDSQGIEQSLHSMWSRRQSTKTNGVSYPVQKAAAAAYTKEGRREITQLVDYYLGNARMILEKMTSRGFTCAGGENSPYIWINTGGDSWDFFDLLLNKAGVVCTPGVGFGNCGQGHIRLSAFNKKESIAEALERISSVL